MEVCTALIFAVRVVIRKYDLTSTFKDSLVYLLETLAGEINRKGDIIKGISRGPDALLNNKTIDHMPFLKTFKDQEFTE